MEKKVDQQQTLYRFVSIRPPQLTPEDGKDIRFVFGGHNSQFYDAVIDRPAGQTKWEALKLFAETFSADSLKDLKLSFPNYILAEWVAASKSTVTPDEMYNKVKAVASLSPAAVKELWDNLFYQLATQQDFYSKELVMQVLILDNMASQLKKQPDDAARKAIVMELANARVVMPVEMFDADGEEAQEVMVNAVKDPIFSTKQLDQYQGVALAKYAVSKNNIAVGELQVMEKKYLSEYQRSYSLAARIFDENANKAYEEATVVEKERILCPSNCPETYYEYENLHLPTFDFTPPVETSEAKLKEELSEESYYIVQSLGLQHEKKIAAIIEGVNESTVELTRKIYAGIQDTSRTVTVGAMAFQEKSLNADPVVIGFLTDMQVPFVAAFQHTNIGPPKGRVQITLNMGYPNADVAAALYTATFSGSSNTNGAFTDAASGNSLNVTFFPNDQGVTVPSGNEEFDFEATLTLTDGTVFELTCTIPLRGKTNGIATIKSKISQNIATPAFVPEKFGIRRLGIADYKKVVSEICCYRESEVSHIENIMQGEFKSKTTTRERIEETTLTTENEFEKENLTDTTTSERFEMQSEVAKLLAQDKQFGAYGRLNGDYKNVTFETGTNYATNTAKEESNRQAVTEGKEITQRASERIMSRFREEMVKKVTESFKDENSHIFDNRVGTGHISGVYRFINAVYKNQIYNYGKRLIYEFMVPQPGKLYRMGMTVPGQTASPVPGKPAPQMPVDPKTLGVENAADVTVFNYMEVAGRYGAEVDAPPKEFVPIGKSYTGKGDTGSFAKEFNDIKVPDGYKVKVITFVYSHRKAGNGNTNVQVQIANQAFDIFRAGTPTNGYPTKSSGMIANAINYMLDTVPVSIIGWDLGSFALNVTVTLQRTDEAYQAWQIKTFDAITAAYRDLLDAYYGSLTETQQEGETLLAANPLFYREIENITLRRICISYLMDEANMGSSYYSGTTFDTFKITQSQPMDNYASHAKFMEQAFEWGIMSYSFYPYYWGKRENWLEMFQSENDDPTFKSFLQSGMARVFVTVRPGFEDAVMHYMKFGEIWNGGQVPLIGDPMYMSIVDELAEQEYVVEETWESVAPTSLTALQEKGVLIKTDGLPCGGGCESGEDNPLVPNDNELKPVIIPPTNN